MNAFRYSVSWLQVSDLNFLFIRLYKRGTLGHSESDSPCLLGGSLEDADVFNETLERTHPGLDGDMRAFTNFVLGWWFFL